MLIPEHCSNPLTATTFIICSTGQLRGERKKRKHMVAVMTTAGARLKTQTNQHPRHCADHTFHTAQNN